ncbi:MAG: hypothetical protein LPJ89_04260 [Hymenobacteraceae bacterium]|nr:hypothetical protein [Hymenobacteraceae bacterium]MDX5396274.1 hypothetical protein [Hymenobacteraceae bacterium]MDX5442978.1 hypothetical protein [Hymenobacteraceae bacterium]MDX5512335.1 hypothetical protein [Hymenobacteraceae bacterium]
MIQHIDQKQALTLWHSFATAINDKQPAQPHIREVNGEQKTFFRKKKLISTGVKDTGTRLILRYIKVIQQFKRMDIPQEIQSQELPSLAISAPELGRDRNLTDRSIRNHLRVLRKAGINLISRYKFNGSRSKIEIWINPKFLWKNLEKQPENAEISLQKSENQAAAPSTECKIFPHIECLETLETKEIEIGNVDKCRALSGPVALPGAAQAANTTATPPGEGACDTFTGDRGPHSPLKPARQAANNPATDQQQETNAPGRAAAKKRDISDVQRQFVENFWFYAWQRLYPSWSFTEHEQKLAKNAIYRGVYLGFNAKLTEKEWDRYQSDLFLRIDLVRKYYERHPEKSPPKPYAEFIAGTGYFDYENTRGFRSTEEWLVNHLRRQQERKIEDLLLQSRRDFRDHRLGNIRKRLAEKSPLELFRFYENKFKTLGKDALNRYYAQHAKPIN